VPVVGLDNRRGRPRGNGRGCPYWTSPAVARAEMGRVFALHGYLGPSYHLPEGCWEAAEDAAEKARRAESLVQAGLIRDLFGDLFRTVALASAQRTPTIVALARAAYDERQLPRGELDLHRLAVLADALEEAGAPDEMVAHLRSPGPHVRGCFVVDLCLGLS
jgi:hypothetical protein